MKCEHCCLWKNNGRMQPFVKCDSCHCIFRLLQIFLPLFRWTTIVNLNNQSGSQLLTEWLLKYVFRWNRRILLLQNQWQVTATTATTQKWNKIIFPCYFALNKLLKFVSSQQIQQNRKKKKSSFSLATKSCIWKWVSVLENSGMLWMVNDATRDAIVWHYTYKCR